MIINNIIKAPHLRPKEVEKLSLAHTPDEEPRYSESLTKYLLDYATVSISYL